MTRDPKATAYIAQSEGFAKPILEHWRRLTNQCCPEVVAAILGLLKAKAAFGNIKLKATFCSLSASYK